MATPAQMQQQFEDDFGSLKDAAAACQAAQDAEKIAEENYRAIVLKKLDSLQTADQILVYLQMYVFQNSLPPSGHPVVGTLNADSCLFGIYGDQVGVQGKMLQVNSYLTAVHNDLQTMVGSDNTAPEVVDNVATDLDQILDELKTNTALQNSMDPTALSNMQTADLTLRQQFYIYGDKSGYNPPINATPTGAPAYTYHFVGAINGTTIKPTDPTYFVTNFSEMENAMQTPGNAYDATAGYKALTDNLNSDTSMTQTVNSEINEKINQLTNFIKTLLGFYENGLLQPGMKEINVAVQNQLRGA